VEPSSHYWEVIMNVRELIERLNVLADDQKEWPLMLEVEREVFFNLRTVKCNGRIPVIILSFFPDPFEEELKKAGVD
jgi:hypothetical protein